MVDRVIELLQADYQVIFAHFPNPDYFGHLSGWMSDVYMLEMANTDWQVGRILAALDTFGLTDETLVILTADHGGHDRLHGANIPEDMMIPWIVAGPGIAPGTVLDDMRVTHTAATALAALGLPQGMAAQTMVGGQQLVCEQRRERLLGGVDICTLSVHSSGYVRISTEPNCLGIANQMEKSKFSLAHYKDGFVAL